MAKETIKGKLIYQPTGPAGEYAKWAVNLHNGCTHGCTYCYNNRGFMSHAFGNEPKLAAPIIKQAEKIYDREGYVSPGTEEALMRNSELNAVDDIIRDDIKKIGADRLRKDGGVFFSFKCDPLEESNMLHTVLAVRWFRNNNIPVTLLTKSTAWMEDTNWESMLKDYKDGLTIGFTLTGMDDMEPNAPSNEERINAMKQLLGFETFVSLEPVINFEASLQMVYQAMPYTTEFRIGLQSPYKKDRYDIEELKKFINTITDLQIDHLLDIIWKDSIFNELDRNNVSYKKLSRPKGCIIALDRE